MVIPSEERALLWLRGRTKCSVETLEIDEFAVRDIVDWEYSVAFTLPNRD